MVERVEGGLPGLEQSHDSIICIHMWILNTYEWHTLFPSCTTGLWLEISKLLPQSWIVMEWVSTLGGHLWQRSSALRPADPGHGLRDLSSKESSGENFKRQTVLQKRNRNATSLSNVSKHSQYPNLPPLLMTLQDQKKTSTCTLHQAHEHLVLAGRVAVTGSDGDTK